MTKKEHIIRWSFPGLLILAGVVTLLCLVTLVSGNEPAKDAQRLLQKFKFVPPESKDEKKDDPREKILAEKNVFTGPKKPWSSQLVGVLGDMAFFQNGSGLKVGEKFNGAKITQIGPDWVEVDVDGKTIKLHVFAGGSGSSGGPPRGMPMRPGRNHMGPPPGFKATPQMIEQFKSLPPEVRAKAMRNMPPHIREQLEKAK